MYKIRATFEFFEWTQSLIDTTLKLMNKEGDCRYELYLEFLSQQKVDEGRWFAVCPGGISNLLIMSATKYEMKRNKLSWKKVWKEGKEINNPFTIRFNSNIAQGGNPHGFIYDPDQAAIPGLLLSKHYGTPCLPSLFYINIDPSTECTFSPGERQAVRNYLESFSARHRSELEVDPQEVKSHEN